MGQAATRTPEEADAYIDALPNAEPDREWFEHRYGPEIDRNDINGQRGEVITGIDYDSSTARVLLVDPKRVGILQSSVTKSQAKAYARLEKDFDDHPVDVVLWVHQDGHTSVNLVSGTHRTAAAIARGVDRMPARVEITVETKNLGNPHRPRKRRLVPTAANLAKYGFDSVVDVLPMAKAYNPSQPRAPQGSEQGGQWVNAAAWHTAGDEYLASATDRYLESPETYTATHGLTREKIEAYLADYKRLFAESKLPKNMSLWRGMVLVDDQFETATEQGYIDFKKPVSFSTGIEVADGYASTEPYNMDAGIVKPVLLHFSGKKGSPAIDADALTDDGLKEWIVPAGRFQINQVVDLGPDKPTWLVGEFVDPNAKPKKSRTKKAYNPDQPRDPGGEDGGRWIPAGDVGSLHDNPDLQKEADKADLALQANAPKADRAIAGFIGHGPMAREAGEEASGLMDARTLERAVATNDPAVMDDLAKHIAPVKDALRSKYGDSMKLYRVQRPVEALDPNVIYMSRAEDGSRGVLSWTSDKRFAEFHLGVKRVPPLFGEEKISAKEAEFAATGRTQVTKSIWLERDTSDGSILIMDERVGGMVTDTDSVRSYISGVNESRARGHAANDELRKMIATAKVPLDDVVWVSDRAGQSEFIVRNDPGSSYYIDQSGKIGKAFNPSQPRAPKGDPDGGKWVAAGGGGEAKPAKDIIGIDNPGGDWLERKINEAREDHQKGYPASGPTTAYTREPVFVPANVAHALPGARGENRRPGEQQYDWLMADVKRDGFDLSADNAILISVDYHGKAYVMEGNTRAAVATALKVEAIPAVIQWHAGGETKATEMFSLDGVRQLVEDYGKPKRKPPRAD